MFQPKRIIFEEEALEYDRGKSILSMFQNKDVEIRFSKSGRVTGIPGKNQNQMYFEGKNTLVVGVRKSLKFESCKPSAHYQLPLVSGCMGMCEYCYLNTQMGKKPYVKVYVNIEDILDKAEEYAEARRPDITIFEGAATSDPVPVEGYTGALSEAIEYFGQRDDTLFRFVTKFTDINRFLNLNHNGRTTIRFSVNSDELIKKFEHKTPLFNERLQACHKIAQAGYNVGFIIAPVFLFENWKEQYGQIIESIGRMFGGFNLKFEVISHRFTKRAKDNIFGIYPDTILPMEEEIRKFKYGQFGYGKYLYKDEDLKDMKNFFLEGITKYFPEKSINYII